jgi:hypothetical protein
VRREREREKEKERKRKREKERERLHVAQRTLGDSKRSAGQTPNKHWCI